VFEELVFGIFHGISQGWKALSNSWTWKVEESARKNGYFQCGVARSAFFRYKNCGKIWPVYPFCN